jgi:hypothetical protein
MIDKTLKEIDRSSNNFHINYDLLVVEVSTEGNPFIFKYNKNPGTYGKCDGCFSTSILKVKC